MDEEKYQEIIKILIGKETENSEKIRTERKYEYEKGILWKKNKDKRKRILRRHEVEPVMYMVHDDPIEGHFSSRIMYKKIKERYYYPRMKEKIEEYVETCDKCQRRKKPKIKNKLNPIKVKEPFYQIGIDIIGLLKEMSKGNKYIVTAIDYFTKWPEVRALKEAIAKEVSNFIYEEIICKHKCSKKILTDRRTHFNNKLIEKLMKKFGI